MLESFEYYTKAAIALREVCANEQIEKLKKLKI
jgi:hypothetical protein